MVSVFVLLFSGAARAETFFANLQGAQESPPTGSSATGYARVFVNPNTLAYSFTVVFNGLAGPQNGAHIHAPAAIGANTGIAINFGIVGGTSGTITGSGTMNATQLAQIRAHQGYVNVHSDAFPGGEIRGQLGPKRPVDFDGDGRQDLSVLQFPAAGDPRPINYLNLNSTTGLFVSGTWGNAATDFPAPGDYDGDGRDDLAYYRNGATAGAQSEFFVLRTSTGTLQYYAWGVSGDQPIARDYDGDGATDVAVFRRGATPAAVTTWYIRRGSDNTAQVVNWGQTGDTINNYDTPVPGDYDGDGKFDIAIYRFGQAPLNTFMIIRSSDGAFAYQTWGNFNSDYILPGDYDGDGKWDFAAARTGTGSTPIVWWILTSSGGTSVRTFGISTDRPVQGDYDGDARTDMALYRPATSTFWIINSFTNTINAYAWGVSGNFPTANFDAR